MKKMTNEQYWMRRDRAEKMESLYDCPIGFPEDELNPREKRPKMQNNNWGGTIEGPVSYRTLSFPLCWLVFLQSFISSLNLSEL